MKNFALCIVAFMFLANTITVSAWATPCMQNVSLAASQGMQDSMDEAMPCHENQQQSPITHCDGLCLCVHVMTSQAQAFRNEGGVIIPVFQAERHVLTQDNVLTRTIKPLFKPPIISS